MAAGLRGDTPVALVENASLPSQSVLLTRLDLLGLSAKAALGDGPALILVGQALAVAPEAQAQALAGAVRTLA